MELEMREFDLQQVCGQIMFKEIDFGLKPWADTGKHIVTETLFSMDVLSYVS